MISQLERASPEMQVKKSGHSVDQLLPILRAFRRSVADAGLATLCVGELQRQYPDQAVALLISIDGALQNGAKV